MDRGFSSDISSNPVLVASLLLGHAGDFVGGEVTGYRSKHKTQAYLSKFEGTEDE